jgi:L-fuculose-phosphate aldolase
MARRTKTTGSIRAARAEAEADADARKQVVDAALRMSLLGLAPGRSGNVSRRWRDGMLITPSGMAYAAIEACDVVYVGPDGEVAAGQRKPSSEWQFHLFAYRARPEMHAVVHTHSVNATVLACAHKPIPAFHYMVAVAGGADIPIVPYATFGTEALARHVVDGLSQRNACLMANHGAIAVGATLEAALDLAAEVESLAEQYIKVLTLGAPHILSDSEMADVLARFQAYGQKAQS